VPRPALCLSTSARRHTGTGARAESKQAMRPARGHILTGRDIRTDRQVRRREELVDPVIQHSVPPRAKLARERSRENGGGGIRTPGPLRVNGFQDRRFRPLSHPSSLRLSRIRAPHASLTADERAMDFCAGLLRGGWRIRQGGRTGMKADPPRPPSLPTAQPQLAPTERMTRSNSCAALLPSSKAVLEIAAK
jgi:hypothetical protein